MHCMYIIRPLKSNHMENQQNTKVDATYVRSIRAFIYLTTTRACHLNFHLPPPDCYHHLTCNYSNPLLPIGKPITLTHFISLICRLYDFTCNYSESTIGQMVSTYVPYLVICQCYHFCCKMTTA